MSLCLPLLSVTAATQLVAAVLSQPETLAGRVAEGQDAGPLAKKGGGGEDGDSVVLGFGSKFCNKIQVPPKDPVSQEQIQLKSRGGCTNGFHIWALLHQGLSSSGGKESDLTSEYNFALWNPNMLLKHLL